MSSAGNSPKPSILRCGAMEIDLAAAELRRHGIRVKLEGKPFELLATLVERRGAMITRDELKARLWGTNDVQDFERNLNVAMSKLRTALGETPENPRYIETVRGRGYRFIAPVTEVNGASPDAENGVVLPQAETGARKQRWTGFHITVMVACAAGLTAATSYFVFRPVPQPKVLEYVQITRDGHPKRGPLMMDGLHVYYIDRRASRSVIARVPAVGGEAEPLLSLDDGTITGYSPIRPEILVRYGTEVEAPFFVVSLLSGARRQLGQVHAHSAIWSPDGEKILYASGNALYTARSDGTKPRKLLDLPFRPGELSWSPDGRVLRLEAFGGGLWECTSDGTGLRRLPVGETGSIANAGSWTPDSRYYFFSLLQQGRSDLWTLKRLSKEPFRLAAGQLNLSSAAAGNDGKKLFALGSLERAEFVRYDEKSGGFLPYLSGVSAEALAFSRDQAWIAYVAYPSKTLWRSRLDGSERVQLTFPPEEAGMPRWSPDSKRVAFMSRPAGGRWKIYAIAPSGGTAEQLAPGDDDAGNPAWSPDGRTLAFAGTPWVHRFAPHTTAIRLLDLTTRKVETLPDTDGLWSPRWSPDGKFLVAETLDSHNLVTYEFATQRWTKLAAAGEEMIGYSSWSSDSKFVYYNIHSNGAGKIFRVNIRARQPELVVALRDLDEADVMGRFFTLTPDDKPVVLRDTSIAEIYSLSLQLP